MRKLKNRSTKKMYSELAISVVKNGTEKYSTVLLLLRKNVRVMLHISPGQKLLILAKTCGILKILKCVLK